MVNNLKSINRRVTQSKRGEPQSKNISKQNSAALCVYSAILYVNTLSSNTLY